MSDHARSCVVAHAPVRGYGSDDPGMTQQRTERDETLTQTRNITMQRSKREWPSPIRHEYAAFLDSHVTCQCKTSRHLFRNTLLRTPAGKVKIGP